MSPGACHEIGIKFKSYLRNQQIWTPQPLRFSKSSSHNVLRVKITTAQAKLYALFKTPNEGMGPSQANRFILMNHWMVSLTSVVVQRTMPELSGLGINDEQGWTERLWCSYLPLKKTPVSNCTL